MPIKFKPMPPQSELREWFAYREDGRLIWAKEPCTAVRKDMGKEAGTKAVRCSIKFRHYGSYRASRLIWAWHNGPIPEGMEIDHIDQNPSNDRIENLRLATSSQQKMNKNAQSNNRSGLKGAYYHACHKGKKWRSQIKVGTKMIFLGYHDTPEAAHDAYASASAKHFGAFDGLLHGVRKHEERLRNEQN